MSEITEELIISQLVKNVNFREKVIGYLKHNFFDDESNEEFFKSVSNLVIEDKIKILDRNTLALRIKDTGKIDSILSKEFDFPEANITLLINEAEKWAQNQILKDALIKSVDNFENKKDRNVIGNLIKEAMSFSFEKNTGLSYKRDIKRRFEFYNRIEEKLATGYDLLDFFTYGGLQKKTLTVFAASSGLGKTLLGTNVAAMMSRKGHNGVYITLELAEEFIARRMDSINTGIFYNDIPDHINDVTEFIQNNVKGDVRIREYPPSKACVYNLMSYIRELELSENFKADWVAVDYIQLMQPNNPEAGQNSHDKYKNIAVELREMAYELNIPVITFSQVNRAGYDNSNMGLSNISDSIGIVNTADLMVGMTQTAEEALENFQTWKIIKNRMGRRGVELRVHQDPNTLRFSQKLNPEELLLISDFKSKRKTYIKEINIEADREGNKETPDEVIENLTSYAKGLEKSINIYSDFS